MHAHNFLIGKYEPGDHFGKVSDSEDLKCDVFVFINLR